MAVSIFNRKTSFYRQEFLFNPENLAQKIEQESDFSLTGYWHLQFQSTDPAQAHANWYLGLSGGKAVFSDIHPLSGERLLKTLDRYLFKLRQGPPRQLLQQLQQSLLETDSDRPWEAGSNLLHAAYASQLITPDDVRHGIRLKLLADLDRVLFSYAGRAQFRPETDLTPQAPMPGFDLSELLVEAQRRKLIWDQIKRLIPSPDCELALKPGALPTARLTPEQEAYLRGILSRGKTPAAIATSLAQDTLEIARHLAKLVQKGLIQVQLPNQPPQSDILIIDDSPVILQQFRLLVSQWGYGVRAHADPATALTVMLESHPAIIFLDINMPDISGFELLKQIRRQAQLAATPLVMLTAERTLSNNWRAQWSGCQFLSKPLSTAEVPQFKQELRSLLETLLPGNRALSAAPAAPDQAG